MILEHQHETSKHQLEVEISLGNTCNYSCSYCPSELHNGSLGWLDYDKLVSFLSDVKSKNPDKEILVQYTGGEPTVYPNFRKLLQFGKEQGFIHSIITNGSRTIRFWKEYASYFDKIHLTYHSEVADIEHFIEVIEVCSKHCIMHVNFTMVPDIFDKIVDAATRLQKVDNTTITLKALRVNFGSELYDYTDEQMKLIKTFKSKGRRTIDTKYTRGMMVYNGSEIAPSKMLVEGITDFKGWNCNIGKELLCVKPNGDIYRGICRVGGRLGNVNDTYELPMDSIKCNKDKCMCITDLMVSKYKKGDSV